MTSTNHLSVRTNPAILRIAMWSGPRNISTAMMRAWENRPDTFVTDEPFYAHYLAHTGIKHPGYKDIIKSQPTDWNMVVDQCLTDTQKHCSIHYQKHMTHHVLPHISLDWLASLRNIFLIRSPEAVVASYSKKRSDVHSEDLGFEHQARLFKHVVNHIDNNPLVINSSDILKKPKHAMKLLCEHCGIGFNDSMLHWPAGPRESDGIWARHWYHNVEQSTCFAAPAESQSSETQPAQLSDSSRKIVMQCQPYYDVLAEHAVTF